MRLIEQVIELKCGGVVLACTFDHRIADAYSTNLFMVAWSELAMSKPLSGSPSFRCSLHLDDACYFDHLYLPLYSLAPPPPAGDYSGLDEAVNCLYYIPATDIRRLQVSTNNRTKIEAFTAYLWRAMARTAARDDESCHMGLVVDGRPRLASGMAGSLGRRFPVAEVEFGWGKATFGSYHFPWGRSTRYVMPMPSATTNGDWVVYVYLLKKVVEVLEAEQPPLFRLLMPDYRLTKKFGCDLGE